AGRPRRYGPPRPRGVRSGGRARRCAACHAVAVWDWCWWRGGWRASRRGCRGGRRPPGGRPRPAARRPPPRGGGGGGAPGAPARVDAGGRQLLAANPQVGAKPLFHTIGAPQPEVFHRGTSDVWVTEGLVRQCATDGQLAALLCLELGKMVAEREAAAPA